MVIPTRFHFLVAVHAFFIKESKVLLLERSNTGYMDGFFSVPAGHVEGGESIVQAVAREIAEEVGIQIEVPAEPSLVMHRVVSGEEERIDFFFRITDWQGEPRNMEMHKCAGLQWCKTDALPEKMIPYVRHALQAIAEGKRFTEFNEKMISK